MGREFGPPSNGVSLEALRAEIEGQQKLLLALQTQFETGQKRLEQFVATYHQERYRQQEALWHDRCLTRCALCSNIPPDEPVSEPFYGDVERRTTVWGGWGLIPVDDAHFVVVSGKADYPRKEYSGDWSETFVVLHRLCTNCYQGELKAYAAGRRTGRILGLNKQTVEEVNQALASSGEKHNLVLERLFGRADKMQVRWHNLGIPEGAYEVGQKIHLERGGTIYYCVLKDGENT